MPQWINMHVDDYEMIYGDRRSVAQGFWAVLRIYRLGEYSKYWHPETQQAVGGPKYRYDDFVVRVMRKPGSGMGSQNAVTGQGTGSILNAGNDDFNTLTFAISPVENLSRVPVEGDVIFEIDKFASKGKPTPPYKATDRYEITHVVKEHGDNGRIEILYAVAKRIQGKS